MPILTAEETFTVGAAGELISESVTVTVVDAPTYPGGKGRLVHPVLGTLDYDIAPDEWDNLDTNILYPPVWQHVKTLSGGASTLWSGHYTDVEVKERWLGKVAVRADQFRTMVMFWRNPPLPSAAPIIWSPNYATALSFYVIMDKVSTGGSSGVTLDYLVLQGAGFVKGPLEITYRVLGVVGG